MTKHSYQSNLLKVLAAALLVAGVFSPTQRANAEDFSVYSVYRGVDLGNPGEAAPQRDYYVNMGSAQGLGVGSSLEVFRRISTYDLTSQKLYKDVMFPFARLKVIHVEKNAAITRVEKIASTDETPSFSPRAVMVGDLVRPAR
ncbi:hypothetical protein K2X30_02770 [bacterium]|jgi:hypothetical protein|nr:hypothetical protein [bacterium]